MLSESAISHLLSKADDRDVDRPLLRQLIEVRNQSGNLLPYSRIDDLFAALRTHARRHVFDDNEIAFDPEILVDRFLLHLLAANVTDAVIIAAFLIFHLVTSEQQQCRFHIGKPKD